MSACMWPGRNAESAYRETKANAFGIALHGDKKITFRKPFGYSQMVLVSIVATVVDLHSFPER